jgi:N-acetylglucosaminyldiphosphoundecaprenol N-acetyl-beta-D-mannosaminyltransferase
MSMAATLAISFVVTTKMKKFDEIAAQLIAKQTLCDDAAQVEDLIETIITGHEGIRVLSFVNAHAVMRSTRESDFFNDLMQSHRLLRDGTGMAMIMQRAEAKPGLNLNGTDFIPCLLQQVPRSWKLALIGTQDPYLSLAAQRLRTMGFEHISTLNGYHPEEMYVEHVRRENPDLVLLAMGMPKQERVARHLAQDSQIATRSTLIVNGGAILDFLSGGVSRAPYCMRRWGIEWLYRFLREPRRMYPRFFDSMAFAMLSQFHSKRIRTKLSQQTKAKNP